MIYSELVGFPTTLLTIIRVNFCPPVVSAAIAPVVTIFCTIYIFGGTKGGFQSAIKAKVV